MLLEANMLHQDKHYVPMQEILELDESGIGYTSHMPDASKKRYYKIF
jgi:hypothetical protein